MAPGVQRRRIHVRGTVQGVGFRPFVYRRAVELRLVGWVRNDDGGVVVEAQGPVAALDALVRALREEPPVLALVESVHVEAVATGGDEVFLVAPTRSAGAADVRVSADVAPCAACLRDMADVADRRHRYPFTNCTDCGPRYTIVQRVPYDRPATTMHRFLMCASCQAEYDDPRSRRFHAQPNACPACGPRLRWWAQDRSSAGAAALAAAVDALRTGGIIALKGVGGYHLACDAADAPAVARLRRRKRRDDKPFAVMVAGVGEAQQLCEVDAAAHEALASARRPIVLAPRRAGAPVADGVAPGLSELGVMLPSSPLHVLLLHDVGRPLVMTSGNRSDEPIAHDDADALERLAGLVDGMLSHDREIVVPMDDSVVRSTRRGATQMVRRARGWVPQPTPLPVDAATPVLAVGAQLKSTVALASGGSAVVSQHLGDLDDWHTHQAFSAAVEHLTLLTGVSPQLVAHDLHPDYASTAWARRTGLPLLEVQHHHAHVAACMVEHGLTSPVLGIAFDGVGLGPDGTLWGGELLVADLRTSSRVGHLSPAALPGGDAAVREPWRSAVSWLHRHVGSEAAAEHGQRFDDRWPAVLSIVASGRAPETSSVGRLFDAVAAVVGVRTRVSYEGQAAVELESLARRGSVSACYPCAVEGSRLDPGPMLASLLADRASGRPVEDLASGFHRGLAAGTAELAQRLASDHSLDTVVLTGGVFQNVLLSELVEAPLRLAGLRVVQHVDTAPNDGSISLGQAAVAAATSQQA